MIMKNIFTRHPHSINETYFEHLKAALGFSFHLLVGGLACFIHAFFPFLFVHTAGKKVHSIVSFMKKTGRWQALEKKYNDQL
jgi:hypothetical protein